MVVMKKAPVPGNYGISTARLGVLDMLAVRNRHQHSQRPLGVAAASIYAQSSRGLSEATHHARDADASVQAGDLDVGGPLTCQIHRSLACVLIRHLAMPLTAAVRRRRAFTADLQPRIARIA